MMTKDVYSLKATVREETGKKVSQLRKQGKLPAVLYGHKIKPLNLTLEYTAFEKMYKQAGDSTLVDLEVSGEKPVKVLVQDYQADPVSERFVHVDFHQVNMSEKISADIALKFIGEAPAVKEFSGILITNLNALSIECLPGDLVHEIEVDLSPLKTFEDIIHVKDIKVPTTWTVKNKLDDVIAQVQEPQAEEIPTTAPEQAAPAEVVGAAPADQAAAAAEPADKKDAHKDK